MTREQFISHVETTREALLRFLVALCCGDCDLADDLAQETYIKAYMASDTFRGEAKFSTWLIKIAYNAFICHRRNARTEATLDDVPGMACDDEADSSFRYQALYMALEALSEKERGAVLLHYTQGYSVKEISGITGCSAEAVKQQLSRGRSHLRQTLHPDAL